MTFQEVKEKLVQIIWILVLVDYRSFPQISLHFHLSSTNGTIFICCKYRAVGSNNGGVGNKTQSNVNFIKSWSLSFIGYQQAHVGLKETLLVPLYFP